MSVGVLILELGIPGCGSLKEKRGRLKPLLARIHKEFNVSAAEVDLLDVWQSAVSAVAVVSNTGKHCQQVLQKIANWVETDWRDLDVVDDRIELF